MSVIVEFSIFPIGKGIHLSQHVQKVVQMVESLPYHSQLTPMGTIVECDTMDECLQIISAANKLLEADADRVYCTAKFDNKPHQKAQMQHKVDAVRRLIDSSQK